jgi:hypothetical protein
VVSSCYWSKKKRPAIPNSESYTNTPQFTQKTKPNKTDTHKTRTISSSPLISPPLPGLLPSLRGTASGTAPQKAPRAEQHMHSPGPPKSSSIQYRTWHTSETMHRPAAVNNITEMGTQYVRDRIYGMEGYACTSHGGREGEGRREVLIRSGITSTSTWKRTVLGNGLVGK